ncbi:MAG: hypothetical protein KF764_13990 [Labilithrix sp.]|nr:hypothetical protein [Labilithrix sp.]
MRRLLFLSWVLLVGCGDKAPSSSSVDPPASSEFDPKESSSRPAPPRPLGPAQAFSSPDEKFVAISGVNDNDIWALGSRGAATWALRHWDGTTWKDSATSVPVFSGRDSFPLGISVTSTDDAWAVGTNGVVRHWDGKSWAPSDTQSFVLPDTGEGPRDCMKCMIVETSLFSVYGAARDDVWAVGYASPVPDWYDPALVVHYDGVAWARVKVDVGDGLFQVWGTGPRDVWAAGSSGLTIHFDGNAWTRMDGGTTLYRWGIWGSAANDVWAVGQSGGITRFDGSRWLERERQPSSDVYREHRAISGSSPNDVWAVGSAQALSPPRAPPPAQRLVSRWDGARWTTAVTNDAPLTGVWVSPFGRVWVTGSAIEEISSMPFVP